MAKKLPVMKNLTGMATENTLITKYLTAVKYMNKTEDELKKAADGRIPNRFIAKYGMDMRAVSYTVKALQEELGIAARNANKAAVDVLNWRENHGIEYPDADGIVFFRL